MELSAKTNKIEAYAGFRSEGGGETNVSIGKRGRVSRNRGHRKCVLNNFSISFEKKLCQQ